MSGQVSRGSAGEYQADERAGVARIYNFQIFSPIFKVVFHLLMAFCAEQKPFNIMEYFL